MRRGWLALGLVGCAPGRRAVEVPLEVQPVAVAEASAFGLTRAVLHLDTVRFRSRETTASVRWLGLMPTALAHPGHDPESDVVGEWLGPAEVDLLTGAALGVAVVYEGSIGSADLDLGPGLLEVEGAYDRGTDALPVDFHFVLAGAGAVSGAGAALGLDADVPPSAWTLGVDLLAMLTDLAPLAPAEGPWALADEASRNTWTFAVQRSDRWTWSPR